MLVSSGVDPDSLAFSLSAMLEQTEAVGKEKEE